MSRIHKRPPRFGLWLLGLMIDRGDHYGLFGDIEEMYQAVSSQKGRLKAGVWFWIQVLKILLTFIKNQIFWSINMIKNYLRIAFRNILKYKFYSFINLAGLTIGISCSILILLWVQDELRVDRFHEKADRIYRVNQEGMSVTPTPLGPTVKEELPEVVNSTRYRCIGYPLIRIKEKAFDSGLCYLVDPAFFEIFTFQFIKGDAKTAFSDPFSLVLTEEAAKTYFGDEDPYGKTVNVENRFDCKITGVIKKPKNTHMEFDLLGPFDFLKDLWGARLDNWYWVSHVTYVLLSKDSQPQEVAQKINDVIKKHAPNLKNFTIHLQNITRIHLHSTFENEHKHRGNIIYVTIFSLIALFIIFIACINFINLTTSRAANRAKEIGIRKVVGAQKQDLVGQFYIESILFSLIALIASVFLVLLFLPYFNDLTGKQITLNLTEDLHVLLILLGIALFTSILCGSYPSLFLSSFKPVKILRGKLFSAGRRTPLRKIMVVTQFTLSIFLIISTFIVFKQLHYIRNRDLGYDRENILCFKAPSILLRRHAIIKQELYKNPEIIGATVSNTLPGRRETTTSEWDWEGKNTDERLVMEVIHVDYDYFKTFNMKLAAGRFLSREHKTDLREGFILNEAAVKALGFKDQSPVGKRFTYKKHKSGKIVGVVKDFHSRPLRYKIGPVVLTISLWGDYDQFCVRVRSNNLPKTIGYIEKVWEKYVTNYPFEFKFFNATIDGLYKAEQRMGKIFNYFTFLAIFISCLGLLGLASYMTAQRTKEIGIRKVHGSSITNIITLLSKQFVQWVLLANLIAWPTAYFFMDRWLQKFAYRTTIEIWIFFLSGFIALVIALITVSYQSIKAAYTNPVDSLRYE